MKKTAVAPSNIAFIKYWGKKDEELRLPSNGSISMNLSDLTTRTTVSFLETLEKDDVIIDGEPEISGRISRHLDRIRKRAGISLFAKVVSENSFPASTGLSSSASGFAALTLAAASAAGLEFSQKDLSIMARQGSGSACRSIPEGIVEWLDGDTSDTSYAVSLAPPSFWDIVDIVAIVSEEKKNIATSEGQKRVQSSIFFPERLKNIDKKISLCKKLIQDRRFPEFGELIEEEALELHAIMLTSRPPLLYWLPTTVQLMKEIQRWRKEGLSAYFTINTGQDVHIICQQKDASDVMKKLENLPEIKRIIRNNPSKGAHLTENHLF